MTESEAIKILNMVEAHGELTSKAKEKAIEALEEIQQYRTIGTVEELQALKVDSQSRSKAYGNTIKIVNQLAEEYKPQLNDNDLMIVESLPSLYPIQEFEEEALQRVIGCAKKEYNNGFCEWKGIDMLGLYNSSCQQKSIVNPFWTYCPYCGKKIKVVEPYKEGSEE